MNRDGTPRIWDDADMPSVHSDNDSDNVRVDVCMCVRVGMYAQTLRVSVRVYLWPSRCVPVSLHIRHTEISLPPAPPLGARRQRRERSGHAWLGGGGDANDNDNGADANASDSCQRQRRQRQRQRRRRQRPGACLYDSAIITTHGCSAAHATSTTSHPSEEAPWCGTAQGRAAMYRRQV